MFSRSGGSLMRTTENHSVLMRDGLSGASFSSWMGARFLGARVRISASFAACSGLVARFVHSCGSASMSVVAPQDDDGIVAVR